MLFLKFFDIIPHCLKCVKAVKNGAAVNNILFDFSVINYHWSSVFECFINKGVLYLNNVGPLIIFVNQVMKNMASCLFLSLCTKFAMATNRSTVEHPRSLQTFGWSSGQFLLCVFFSHNVIVRPHCQLVSSLYWPVICKFSCLRTLGNHEILWLLVDNRFTPPFTLTLVAETASLAALLNKWFVDEDKTYCLKPTAGWQTYLNPFIRLVSDHFL